MPKKKTTAPAAQQVIIEAVQYTPGRSPVLIQYTGHGAESGPMARTILCHTTQEDLEELSGIPGKWGDEEIYQVLMADLESHGIVAELVENVDPEIARQAAEEELRTQQIAELEARLAELRGDAPSGQD